MKSILKFFLFTSVAGISMSSPNSLAAGVDTTNGDLFIAFYQILPSGVGDKTYIFNLGPAATFRENTLNNSLVSAVNPSITDSNIAADLTTAFGETWAEDGTVFWCVVGGLNQTTVGLVGGERQQTSYVSNAVTNFVAVGPTSSRVDLSGGPRNTLRNNIEAYQTGNNLTGSTGSNARGAIVPISVVGTLEEFLPPLAPFGQFGVGLEIRQSFGVGLVAGSESLEGALDVWRLVGGSSSADLNESGTDLTSGLGNGNAVLGQGQYIGTITLDSSGDLRIGGTATGTGGNFDSWALENNVTGGANGDSDQDGISNLVEYALNLDSTGSDKSAGTFSGNLLTFSKRGLAYANGDVDYLIQVSNDLGVSDPWQTATPTSNTPTEVTYSLLPVPGTPKKFARLVVKTIP